ncbi:MAG: anti-anti-sigma factor [Gammaproteobacteria bacterium SG8_11]|nr:MAG: anti-anti-sigma factor [Gammaproteobacteria bacterium SG8_11]
MQYSIESKGPFTVILLSGDVDLQYSPEARQQILKYLNEGHHVMVDLGQVKYIDSSGVASLVEGYQVAKSKNLQFGLLSVSDSAMQVLQLARLDQVFPIYKSIDEVP